MFDVLCIICPYMLYTIMATLSDFGVAIAGFSFDAVVADGGI